MNRTTIELSHEGNILVTRETPRGTPGSARDRRRANRAGEPQGEWRKLDRKIYRHGVVESPPETWQPGVTILPKDSPEIKAQADDNYQTTLVAHLHAEVIADSIDEQNAAFKTEPLPVIATPTEACREYATNFGMDHTERAWICTPFDTWERNPFYHGPAMPHPEDMEFE